MILSLIRLRVPAVDGKNMTDQTDKLCLCLLKDRIYELVLLLFMGNKLYFDKFMIRQYFDNTLDTLITQARFSNLDQRLKRMSLGFQVFDLF